MERQDGSRSQADGSPHPAEARHGPEDAQPGASRLVESDHESRSESASEQALFDTALRAATPRVFVTHTLMVVNVVVFLAMIGSGVHFMEPLVQDLIDWGANFGPETTTGEWWRLLTSTFLHIGAIHLAFNMWVLHDIGRLVERLVGNSGFLILYIVSGLLASAVSVAWNPLVVSAGASGAIFGVLGALFGVLVRARGEIPMKQLSELRNSSLAFLGYNLVYGALQSDVDMAAHLGGLGAGFLGGLVLSHPAMLKETGLRSTRNAILSGVGLAVLVGTCLLLPGGFANAQKELDHFAEVERSCIDALGAAFERLEAAEIGEPEFAAILDSDILPPWRAARERLMAFGEVPAPLEEHFQKMREYVTLREEAWTLLSRSIRDEDPLLVRQLNEKQSEVDQILDELNAGDEE